MTKDEIRMTKEALKVRNAECGVPNGAHPPFFPHSALVAFIVCLASFLATADEWRLPPETAKFKPGRGAELAIANCLLCHSADYVSTQPRLTQTAWKATVEKMRLKYGAPIATNKVDEIAEYLAVAYGKR